MVGPRGGAVSYERGAPVLFHSFHCTHLSDGRPGVMPRARLNPRLLRVSDLPHRKMMSVLAGLGHPTGWSAESEQQELVWFPCLRKVDVRLPGNGNSNSHGARPAHPIITMIKWIRTGRLSIKNYLSPRGRERRCGFETKHPTTKAPSRHSTKRQSTKNTRAPKTVQSLSDLPAPRRPGGCADRTRNSWPPARGAPCRNAHGFRV